MSDHPDHPRSGECDDEVADRADRRLEDLRDAADAISDDLDEFSDLIAELRRAGRVDADVPAMWDEVRRRLEQTD